MRSFYYLSFFGNILLILFSLTNAIPLDTSCTNNTQCVGTGATCRGGNCQCDTPWYTPCGTTQCNLRERFVYEGEDCRNNINCLENAVCNGTEPRCRCNAAYTAINGLCYKSLNLSCILSTECWSGECRDGVCKCPLGFIPREDNNRCKRQLAKIYANWTDANQSRDFCYDINSCLDSSAICHSDSQHSEKYCKCPSKHIADYNKQECRLIEYNELSPSVTPLQYGECGKCNTEHALCVHVDNQTTCWCRAGYMKNNDKCELNRKRFIFSDGTDIGQHGYAFNCSIYANNGTITENSGLCACARGYKFVDKTSLCQPIKPVWENDNFEYGVCTRIKSDGYPVEESGLCPSPLSCQGRQDKYVCSCGRNSYLDESGNPCYYFLETNLTNTTTNRCPPNSELKDGKCQCLLNGTYSVSADKKRCELNLINTPGNSGCITSDATKDKSCSDLYLEHAKFCRQGECRCSSTSSYYENNRCVTLIYVDPGTINGICPPNARNINSQCTCDDGYRATATNRTCERKVNQLYDSTNAPPQGLHSDVEDKDCVALYPNQYVKASNNLCVCNDGTFSNDSACVFYIDYSPLPVGEDSKWNCPKFAEPESSVCKCSTGYKYQNNRTCVELTNRVYPHDEPTGENITGINSDACIKLFGNAAEVAQDRNFCRCKDGSYAFWNQNKCYFVVETTLLDITSNLTCPPTSIYGVNICLCPTGYQPLSSKHGCEQKPLYSSNLQSIDINTFGTKCDTSYTDEDCEAFHGVGAVCRNNTCYCDRSRSYVQNSRCELYSKLVFPGAHEHHLYTCDSQDDCGADADKNGIECGFINNQRQDYTVCKCKSGYIFNPVDSTCVKNRCYPQCPGNEECDGYRCICQIGFYRNPSGDCVKFEILLKLHDKCNRTYLNELRTINEELVCSSCERVQCISGYRDDGSKCVKNDFDDRCLHETSLCSQISPASYCDSNENKCTCSPGYYRTNGERICARAVGRSCVNHIDCGDFGKCLLRQCKCDTGRKEEEVFDSLGRKIIRCISIINGVDQIRFNPILFLFFILARLFFA